MRDSFIKQKQKQKQNKQKTPQKFKKFLTAFINQVNQNRLNWPL
jgi:hypothetical protein